MSSPRRFALKFSLEYKIVTDLQVYNVGDLQVKKT